MLIVGPAELMSLDALASHLDVAARYIAVWGPLLVFVLMAIESSLFPLPSEIVMIPVGFWAARGEFPPLASPLGAVSFAVFCGAAGSIAGAYFNYYLALWAGRPLLYRFGKYVFLKPSALERTEEIFREYGDMATFVGRLLPVVRHLISIPAGFSRMDKRRFTFFTGLGAALWCTILAAIGWWLGKAFVDEQGRKLDYVALVHRGKDILSQNFGWILLGLACFVVGYLWLHHRVMQRKKA